MNNSINFHAHAVAKFKTRLIRSEKFLAIGTAIASASHLRCLMKEVGKDKHLLQRKDLNAQDKMNYKCCERLVQPHVRDLLKQNVPGIIS